MSAIASSSRRSPPTPPRSSSPSPPPSSVVSPAPIYPLPTTQRRSLPAVLMRAGTSRGLFLHLRDLPKDRAEWTEVILSAMGSPDCFGRQLDGVGAGTSTTSKVAVVWKSEEAEVDVEYLFIQVPVNGTTLDFSGNCGNMASGVGPFAVDEGFIKSRHGEMHEMKVRIRNVNTNKIIHSNFSVQHGIPVEFGSLALDGISTLGSPIRLEFVSPGGSMTGSLLPTGCVQEDVVLGDGRVFRVSAVDAANPFVFVGREELGLTGGESVQALSEDEELTETLMEIRAIMAVRMGLSTSIDKARLTGGTPKIAIAGPPCDYVSSDGRRLVKASETDLWIRPFSMGRPHPAIQMTGAVCVAAASAIPGSLIHSILQGNGMSLRTDGPVIVGHASGTMATEGKVNISQGGDIQVESGSVYRTARRLMQGSVLYHAK